MSDELHDGDRIPEEKENANAEQANPKPDCADTPIPVVTAKSNLTPAKGHDCRKKYKRIKEEVKFWFEMVGVIVGVVVLIIMYGQFLEMQRTRTLDERAWVGVCEFTEGIAPNGMSYIRAKYKNTGKTPAINVVDFITNQADYSKIPVADEKTSGKNSMLNPNAEGDIDTGYISVNEIANIESGKETNYIYGTIWYDDIFGKHHWSQFSYRMGSGRGFNEMRFVGIPIHNSSDDDQTN